MVWFVSNPHVPLFHQGLSKALGMDEQGLVDEIGSHWWPNRGLGGSIPQDPGRLLSG